MTTKGSGVLAWCSGIAIVIALPGILVFESGAGARGFGTVEIVWNFSALVMFLAVGLTLALKVPRNPIGWLLICLSVGMALDGLTSAYGGYSLNQDADLPGVRLAAAWGHSWWPLWFAILGAILFLLPDGKLPSPRWRPVAVAGVGAVALALSGGLLGNDQRLEDLKGIEPLGFLPARINAVMLGVGTIGMTVVLGLIVLAMMFR
jgi:hypothetical protein